MNEALLEITKRSKSYQEADFLPTIFRDFRNEAVTGSVPVVLFGAGSAGRELCPVLKLHGVNPACFCDNNPSRTGELFCGLPIISVSELRERHKNSLIVVTAGAYRDEVKQQLVEIGFNDKRILTIANQEALCYYTHLAQWYWPEDDLLLFEHELFNIYNLLSDQKSRDIFTSRIALFVRGADYQSLRNFVSNFSDIENTRDSSSQDCKNSTSEAYLQFNNDLLLLGDNEVLIDGGAYTGDSTLEFINACTRNNLKYREVICYEPDPGIFEELKKNTAQHENISLKPFGLWSHASSMEFVDSNTLKPGSTRILSAYDDNNSLPRSASGRTEISTTSIDEDVPDKAVTMIKMDIEGAEMNALHGAMQTIKRCRPKLVISAYHKRNDLFEIPLLIHQMVPDYKFYFRHFSNNLGETTLFAIA
ncbi:putative FkbM family methyltransferase [Syntrophobacter sp. SbD1]|nr:putative FkbM family methyltransferase [Syntrophobacter sp. SbD1]